MVLLHPEAPLIPVTFRALCLAFLHDCSHCIFFAVKVSVFVSGLFTLWLTEIAANDLPLGVLRPSPLRGFPVEREDLQGLAQISQHTFTLWHPGRPPAGTHYG